MEIQILDKRPALSLAISLAKEQNVSQLPQWESELTQMVIEVTRKFHGSLTTDNVRRGLETCVGILSLGLMRASEGGIDPELWLQHLQGTGLKEISKQAVEMVKRCAALPSTDFLNPAGMDFDLSPREHLLRFAKTGYLALIAMEADRRQNKLQVDLARWLLQNTAMGASARRNLAAVKENVTAEDVFSYVLPRQSGITGQHLREETEVPEDEDFEFGGHRILLPSRLWQQAKERFDTFAETIPDTLKRGLFIGGASWFDIYIARLDDEGTTPKKPAASTPKKSAASTPKKSAASTPKKPAASTPKKSAASTPKKPAASAPKKSAASTPKKPAASAPKKPAASARKKSAASTPKKPAASAPKKPAASAPKKPAASAPKKPATSKKAAM